MIEPKRFADRIEEALQEAKACSAVE